MSKKDENEGNMTIMNSDGKCIKLGQMTQNVTHNAENE